MNNDCNNKVLNSYFDYHFKELKKWIIGEIKINYGTIFFTLYGNKVPIKGEKIMYEGKIFKCEAVLNTTEDDELNEGLSFSNVELLEIVN